MRPFAEPLTIGQLMADYPHIWGVCGGWAIDLFLDRPTRTHKDVDIAVLRRDQLAVQDYLEQRGWSLEKAESGALVPWEAGELIALPVHIIWCKNPHFTPDFLEILFDEADAATFFFRRDSSITHSLERAFVQSACGLPILAPEIVLLYKAKNLAEEGNNVDFQNTLASLDREQRAWLKVGLDRAHPGHPWLSKL